MSSTGDADAGLQAERTRLAWSRTALSAAGVGALLAHGARGVAGLVCGGVILLCAAGFLLCGASRYRRRSTASLGLSRWVAVLAVLPAIAAIVGLLAR